MRWFLECENPRWVRRGRRLRRLVMELQQKVLCHQTSVELARPQVRNGRVVVAEDRLGVEDAWQRPRPADMSLLASAGSLGIAGQPPEEYYAVGEYTLFHPHL